MCIFVITLYVTLFVIFAGFVFTMILVHLFAVKRAKLVLMVVPDIVTSLDAGYTKTNRIQGMTAGEKHRRFKFSYLK